MQINRTKVMPDDWTALNRELDNIRFVLEKLKIFYGNGSPENEVAAPLGAIYLDLTGGTSSTLFVKESNDNESSGWIAK